MSTWAGVVLANRQRLETGPRPCDPVAIPILRILCEMGNAAYLDLMSVEVLYLLRKDEPGVKLRELDDVTVLADVVCDDGATIPAGTEGTVVAIWDEGAAFEVEFSDPEGALATVPASILKRVGHHIT